MPWKPSFPGEVPTLGYLVIDWMTELLAAPDRPEYEPFVPYLEQEDFLLRFYEVDPKTGRRKRRRGVLSRSRGWGKSPFLAAITLAEALAPVVPAGWDADGQPVARPWSELRTPRLGVLAVSEAQTANTWAPLLEMCDGPLADEYPGLEPLDTFVNLPHRGKIEPITSSARSVKGKPFIFAVMDQALALDTPIPTPSGWTTMGAIRSGDLVYGSDGHQVRVTEAKPASLEHDCYRVTFADGTSVVASEGHLWKTRVRGSGAKARIRTTGEMLRDGRVFRVPVAPARDAASVDLPVPPYLLGLWLGDGTRGKCELSVHGGDLGAVQDALRSVGVESWPRRYAASAGGYSPGGDQVNLTFTRARGFAMVDRPQVAKALSSLACYRDKHVPSEYLRGSIEQRTELLRGLMDSDGCSTEAGTCTFVGTEKRLADAVVELLRSLGQVTSGAKWVVDDRYTGGGKYRVDFTPRGGFMPFRLPRKAARVRQHRRGAEWITVTSITRVPRVAVRCIAVDGEDHLFAAGVGGHLTHNTEEWVASNGGHNLFEKVKNNTAKTGGSFVESPNAFIPGEDSVAERSAAAWAAQREGRSRDDGLFYDHREAPADTDMADRESLVAGLRLAYGDSSAHPGGCVLHDPPCAPGHVDLDHLVGTIWDPTSDPQVSRADFLNQITHASDSWLSQPEVAAVGKTGERVQFGEVITLGFDGSRRRARGVTDATALIGCRVSDGHLFTLGVWEQPDGPAGRDWEVPVVEVLAAVRDAFELYEVAGFYADPAKWEGHVAAWEAEYGSDLEIRNTRDHPIEWWMSGGRSVKIVRATERLYNAIVDREITYDGSGALTRHFLNARRRESSAGIQIAKEHPMSWRKIDAAVAAILAFEARTDALAAGLGDSEGAGAWSL